MIQHDMNDILIILCKKCACSRGINFLRQFNSFNEAWERCNNPFDMMWVLKAFKFKIKTFSDIGNAITRQVIEDSLPEFKKNMKFVEAIEDWTQKKISGDQVRIILSEFNCNYRFDCPDIYNAVMSYANSALCINATQSYNAIVSNDLYGVRNCCDLIRSKVTADEEVQNILKEINS